MKMKKLGTFLLIFVMVCTVILSAGCEKDDDSKTNQDDKNKVTENGNATEEGKGKDGSTNNGSKKKVTLMKRNGVEWKENTRIKSKVGAKKYKVVWGDTLSLIARTWHVNCYKLAKYNKIKNIDLIEVDQIIYNPAYKGK